jgi:hypothetical protein
MPVNHWAAGLVPHPGKTMTDPKAPDESTEPTPRSDSPTIEELMAENQRLRVRLALHEYFDAAERFKKKGPRKKRERSKR